MTPDLVMICRCGLEYLCDDIDEADAWLRTHEHKPQGDQRCSWTCRPRPIEAAGGGAGSL